MRIKKMLSQHRRDFTAVYICEHCSHEENGTGYDDGYFHQSVIPEMKCGKCGLTAGDDYKPNTTRYPDGMSV